MNGILTRQCQQKHIGIAFKAIDTTHTHKAEYTFILEKLKYKFFLLLLCIYTRKEIKHYYFVFTIKGKKTHLFIYLAKHGIL